MRPLPSGVVTFLFTDIEGSTALWERARDAMRVALAQHDALVRSIVEANDGVVFKNVGDACCCAFANPASAIQTAVEAQRALGAQAWPPEIRRLRVRMGIHSGECTVRGEDYFGPAVNRVARLMSVAHGEQVVLSQATAALVRDAMPEGISLRQLGISYLRGLSEPEPTFQAIADGLRVEFPPLAAIAAARNNLPAQLSSFVGRRAELDTLNEILGANRLVTITGPGGIGKTRIALQLAGEAMDRFPDGVWFIELTAVQNPEFVAQTVAAAINVHEVSGEPIETTIAAELQSKRLLLVVDNCEQVLPEVARIVRLLLSRCAQLSVVTTSRESLHLPGEQIYRLGPMALDAPKLFVERARQAAPAARFDNGQRVAVHALCERLEGIPLAIELACARLSAMPLPQLASRLTSGLSLRSKDSTERGRHRTLRETIAWSYKLLLPDEKATLADLSIFRGSCTPDAIAAVAGDVPNLDDAVESLVDKSLLQSDEREGEPRYRLLDVVREFAREQLGDDAQSAAARHARYYSGHAADLCAMKDQFNAYGALDADVTNLRAAMEWNIAHDRAAATALIMALARYWRTRGLLSEARSWIGRVVEALSDDDFPHARRQRAEALSLAAAFSTLQDDLTASLKYANDALELARDIDYRKGAAEATFRIAEAVHRQGHLKRAEKLYGDALDSFRASNDASGQMLCLGNLGMAARQHGDLERAAELLEEARRRAAELGESRIGAEFAMHMGWVHLGLGHSDRSRELFARVLGEQNDAGDRYGVCCARHGLATVDLTDGDLREAQRQFMATLEIACALQLKDYIARALHGLAAIKANDGNFEDAARFLGLADRLFAESGRELRDSTAYDVAAGLIEQKVPAARLAELRAQGARMTVADALQTGV